MNLLIPGIAAVSALVAFPSVLAAAMRRNPGIDDVSSCYGLDGRSSEICCDNPAFADPGCCCDCLCHHRDESCDDRFSAPSDYDHGKGHMHHHHLHRHQGSSELHPANLRRL